MKYALECLPSVKKDILPLIKEHWELIALNKGSIKLNPDWEQYAALDASGIMKVFTARDNGALVGYFILLVNNSLHYKDHVFAVCDIIFVTPEARKGATGYKLLKYAENWCKENNVSLLNINTKVHMPFDSLLEKTGYNLIERLYSKYLGK
ncbi:GNAT family N-acetyltransferase [Porticoccaceae bacterium]|nr:GNAT family N-acetyltransferase [Porticoccaceae bacterium]